MAKGKGKSTSSGPHKSHGPKKHLFRWTGPMKWQFGKLGVLSKYWDYESFSMACTARGKRSITRKDFNDFIKLDKAQQDEYFRSLNHKD